MLGQPERRFEASGLTRSARPGSWSPLFLHVRQDQLVLDGTSWWDVTEMALNVEVAVGGVGTFQYVVFQSRNMIYASAYYDFTFSLRTILWFLVQASYITIFLGI